MVRLLLTLLMTGCVPQGTAQVPNLGGTNTGSFVIDTGTPAGTAGATPTGSVGGTTSGTTTGTSSGSTTGVAFDCAAISEAPLATRQVPGARGYHDVEYDDAGNMVGQDANGNLVRADQYGTQSLWIPNVGTVQQMVRIPSGEIAAAYASDGIVGIDPTTGATRVINGNIIAYGLILGPDNQLYAADQNQIYRIDPVAGTTTVLLGPGALPSGGPRVISFNLDYTLMYIGTYLGSQGRIYTMPLDAQLDPMGPPVEFVSGVGDGQYHDTAGVDICGYLWVANFWDRTLYRISPGGDVLSYWTAPGSTFASDYGHGMKWGTGTNGWDEFKIYMPQPYRNHEVIEVDLGVPSRDWTGGYAINLP